MKLLISRARLWQKIENDVAADGNVDVGLPIAAFGNPVTPPAPENVSDFNNIEPGPAVLGLILRELRRNEALSIEELASQTQVEVSELRGLEQDPSYRARPRTIYKLAGRLSLPQQEVAKLAGAVQVNHNDNADGEEEYKFAAISDDLSTMTPAERTFLAQYVKAIVLRIKA